MAKKEKVPEKKAKKGAKKAKAPAKKLSLRDGITRMFEVMDEVDNEVKRFEEKGVAASLGRARKSLQELRQLAKDGRISCLEMKKAKKGDKPKKEKKSKK